MAAFRRILVVSDSHGDRRTLRAIVERHHDAAAVFHLGDGATDTESLKEDYPQLPFYVVCGNCDSVLRGYPADHEVMVGGVRFFAVHGDRYGVKSSPLRFAYAARQRKAQVALFGHTHQAVLHREEGFCLLNPGSVRDGGYYALIDMTDRGLFPHLERLDH